MEMENNTMDTDSDSIDDGGLQNPMTPPVLQVSGVDSNFKENIKAEGHRCNFDVVIDIELDSIDDYDNVKVINDEQSSPPIDGEEINQNLEADTNSDSETDYEEQEDDIPSISVSASADSFQLETDGDDPTEDHDSATAVNNSTNFYSDQEISESQEDKAERQKMLKLDEQKMKEMEEQRKIEFQKLKKLSPSEKIFPDVRPSHFHTVAFIMTDDYKAGDVLKPYPTSFTQKWNPKYVPMPCCKDNIRILKIRNRQENGESPEEPSTSVVEKTIFVWDRIEFALSKPLTCCQDISNAIKQYCGSTNAADTSCLQYAIETLMTSNEQQNFFSKVIPVMQKLCIDLRQHVTCPIPLLVKFMNHSISLSQKQIACLLANAFFSTFPKRLEDDLLFPSINFNGLCNGNPEDPYFNSKANKLRCILHYFERISEEMPKGVVTFTRKSIRNSRAPDWSTSDKKMSKLMPLIEGTIETDGAGLLQVDFANKIIGGGVLGRGTVQEEILFVIYPELLLTRLFTEKLTACEAIVITGCERFSQYSGYSSNFEYDGDFYDCTAWDRRGRKCTQIVAIDALYISKPMTQFHPKLLTRELNKAYVGFSTFTSTSVAIATGKWGCGAFHGDPQLKTIIQLLAASQTGRDIAFFTFGDTHLLRDIEAMYKVVKHKTIREVWKLLLQYNSLFCGSSHPSYSLEEFFTEFASGAIVASSLSDEVSSSTKSDSKIVASTSKKLSEIPITRFYSSTSSTTSKAKSIFSELETGKPQSRGGSSTNSVNGKGEDWLTTFDNVKSSWNSSFKSNSNKPSSEDRPEKKQTATKSLSDDQISEMLTEDVCMDTSDNSKTGESSSSISTEAEYQSIFSRLSSPIAMVKRGNSDISCQSSSRALKSQGVKSSASVNFPLSSSTSICSSPDPPKQKKQMTLKDYFA